MNKNPIKIEDYIDTIDKVEKILGYVFEDKNLILKAITHPSAVQGYSVDCSYERLEFLGDSLLGAVTAYCIFDKHKNLDEGKMTHMKVALVSGSNLSDVAKNMGFEEFIIFGKSECSTGKRGMKNALEDVYEACVAAIFLDGGPVECWQFVERSILNGNIDDVNLAIKENPKSALQELIQENKVTPEYKIVKEEGPAHNKTFYADVLIGEKVIAQGVGRSKKEAETDAARKALDMKQDFL